MDQILSIFKRRNHRDRHSIKNAHIESSLKLLERMGERTGILWNSRMIYKSWSRIFSALHEGLIRQFSPQQFECIIRIHHRHIENLQSLCRYKLRWLPLAGENKLVKDGTQMASIALHSVTFIRMTDKKSMQNNCIAGFILFPFLLS